MIPISDGGTPARPIIVAFNVTSGQAKTKTSSRMRSASSYTAYIIVAIRSTQQRPDCYASKRVTSVLLSDHTTFLDHAEAVKLNAP